jgi:hypothetical protein
MRSGFMVSARSIKNLLLDEGGAVMVEVTVTFLTFVIILFGIVEFSYAFYQWNAATKAIQYGARLAAVSDPIAEELVTLTGLESGENPGDEMPTFYFKCTAAQANCAGDGGPRNLDALNTLVYGRAADGTANEGCVGTGSNIGMCNIFSRITPNNVVVEYQYTKLGYAGRPGGPVPTITLSLTNLSFEFVLLGGLLGFGSISMPSFATTMTGEDMCVEQYEYDNNSPRPICTSG